MRYTTFFFALLSFLIFCSVSANREISFEERKNFIGNYTDIAVSEMHRTGVPASITLAQFILESDWGRGELFRNANAGFGVKCKNTWTGDTYYLEDDDYHNKKLIESCFRKYPSVEATFIDHSDFLKKRSYYQPLFLLDRHDYKSWAHGLKECKYATDPTYPKKLIKLIETYGLHSYDYQEENLPVAVGPQRYVNEMLPTQVVVRPTTVLPVARPVKVQNTFTQTNEELSIPAYSGIQAPVRNTSVAPTRVQKKRRVSYQIKPRHRRPVAGFYP